MFLGIIPARGGSKSIPNKNLIPAGGKPLLEWTVRAARNCCLNHTILSTDCHKIAAVGRRLGVDVPFIRPRALSTDRASMIGVLQHALEWWASSGRKDPEGIVLLQPTSPLRRSLDIDTAVGLFREKQADSVVSMMEVPHQFNPVSLMVESADGTLRSFLDGPQTLRRQDKPLVLARNGPAILVLRPNLIRRGELYTNNTFPYRMNARNSLDIDEPHDLAILNALWNEYEA